MFRNRCAYSVALVCVLSGAGSLQPAVAQEELKLPFDAYQGLRQFTEVNEYGSDTIDLQHLGLVVRQELSPAFRANDLPYQVLSYYQGPGWFRKPFPHSPFTMNGKYSWFTPSTLWGPMGAGWNVHMGKLLSSGLADPDYYENRVIQRGFTADCTTVPLCGEYGGPLRWVENEILDAGGRIHAAPSYCLTHIFPAADFSWITAGSTSESACQGLLGWRTPDGTLYEINDKRLVNRVTDLSGNRIEIEYHDFNSISQIRDCATNPNWCEYETEMQDVYWTWQGHDYPTHEVMSPLKSIRDSNGRRIDFVLTSTPIGGKYRIAEVRSVAPNGQQAIYRLTYEERNVSTLMNAAPAEYWGEIPGEFPCNPAAGAYANCLSPQLDGPVQNDVIENAAFLVKVEGPDGLTTEYDYYPWGDLKSIRTVHGAVVKYTWKYWMEATSFAETYGQYDVNAMRGIKLISRQVTPRTGDAQTEPYLWSFEKNELPETLGGLVYDQDRTLVTLPSGNEVAYRFSDAGLVRNIKTYAGTAFRWVQGHAKAEEVNIASRPSGRLLREVERWVEQGSENDDITRLIQKNPGGPGDTNTVFSPRVIREETYFIDEPIGAAPTTDITQDFRYDLRGTTFAFDAGGTQKTARQVFSHTVWALEGWQRQRGYTREIVEGSAVGFRRVQEKKFTDFANLTPEEALAQNVNFRWPVAWVRETQASGSAASPRVSSSLTEFQYDTVQLHKVAKAVRRKNTAVTPHDHPYTALGSNSPGDAETAYEYWPARSSLLPLPSTPTPTAYGPVRRVTRRGGDPVDTRPNAAGDSMVVYDQTISYEYGVPSVRQYAGVGWRSVDADVDPSGRVIAAADSSGVTSAIQYDAAGDPVRLTPALNGTEDPLHFAKDIQVLLPRDDEHRFPGGGKLFARDVWRGPTGADFRTNVYSAYLRAEYDGLGRAVRLERKLEDGSKVSKRLTYGALGGQASGRWGLDRITREEEWAPLGASNVPSTTLALSFEGTGDTLLDGRPDPFERTWRVTFPDSTTKSQKHFGTSYTETTYGIQGRNGSQQTAARTYRNDVYGRLRVLDSPSSSADGMYEYDLFGQVATARLAPQVQRAPLFDASGICTDQFAASNTDGQLRSYVFDSLGLLRSVVNPENNTTTYHSFDPLGRLLLSTDANGSTLRRIHDPAGRPIQLELCRPAAGSTDCDRTTPGAKLLETVFHNSTQTPSRGASLGKLITIKGFDDAALLLSQDEIYYDPFTGRVSETRTAYRDWYPGSTIEGATSPFYSVNYGYSRHGLLQNVTYPRTPNMVPTTVTYDYVHGLMSRAETNRGVTATVAHHPSGRMREILYSNNTRTLIAADSRARTAGVEVLSPAGQSLWRTGTYRYDGGGNLFEIGDPAPFPADDYWKFAYDENERLVWSKQAGYEMEYGYDPYGNLATQHFLASPGGPVPGMEFTNRSYIDNQVDLATYTHDPNGEMRDSPGLGYDYDARSRLLAVGTVDAASQLIPNGVYRYSGLGLRMSRDDRLKGWTTFYFRDLNGEVLSEFSRPSSQGAPNWSRDYVYAEGQHLAMVEEGPPTLPGGFVTCAQSSGRDCGQTPGTQSIFLDWVNSPDPDIYGYRVYRASTREQFDPASGQAPPVKVHTGDLPSSQFADGTPKNCNAGSGNYCWYAVSGVDRSGIEGGYSAPLPFQINDVTAPGTPGNPVSQGVTKTSATLAWTAPATVPLDFLGYYVYRSGISQDPNAVKINTTPTSGLSITDMGLLCNTSYYYRVRAVDTASNLSAFSSQLKITTSRCGKTQAKLDLLDPDEPADDGEPVVGLAEVVETPPADEISLEAVENSVEAEEISVELEAAGYQSVGQTTGSYVTYLLHTDHLGSIRAVSNLAGQIVSRHRYFPFGQEIGPLTRSSLTHRYIGREFDSESGLLYLMHRYAMPKEGARFTTVDPLAGNVWQPGSLNRYAYAFNSPLNYSDLMGLDGKTQDDENKCPPGATCITVFGNDPGAGGAGAGGGAGGGGGAGSGGAKSGSSGGSSAPGGTGAATTGTSTSTTTTADTGSGGAGGVSISDLSYLTWGDLLETLDRSLHGTAAIGGITFAGGATVYGAFLGLQAVGSGFAAGATGITAIALGGTAVVCIAVAVVAVGAAAFGAAAAYNAFTSH